MYKALDVEDKSVMGFELRQLIKQLTFLHLRPGRVRFEERLFSAHCIICRWYYNGSLEFSRDSCFLHGDLN